MKMAADLFHRQLRVLVIIHNILLGLLDDLKYVVRKRIVSQKRIVPTE